MSSKSIKEKLDIILSDYKAGQFTTIVTHGKVKTLAAYKDQDLTKKVTYKGARIGIDYNNMNQTKQNRSTGEIPHVPQSLPWGTWLDFPKLIEHKGTHYLRFYAQKSKVVSEYYLNGKKVDKKEIDHMLPKKSNRNLGDQLTLTTKLENILEL